MPLDSLQSLFEKAHSIETNIQQHITHIQTRKGTQVITDHHYTLQTKPPTSKRQKIRHDTNHSDGCLLQIIDETDTINADDIISAWSYNGKPLTKEKIAIDEFIDRRLHGFNDLIRLNEEYGALLDKYSRLLTDEKECRRAVEDLVDNMEVLEEALGDINDQLQDKAESDEVNSEMALFVKKISLQWKKVQSRISRDQFDNHSMMDKEKAKLVDSCEENDRIRFTFKHTLLRSTDSIWTLQPYILKSKHYLASAGDGKSITIWDMSNNTVADTLTGHSDTIYALALYVQNGVQMLASASDDHTIKLWNLHNHINIETLSDNSGINALAVYEEDGRMTLISGSDDSTLKLWDLQTHNTTTTLLGHEKAIDALTVYNHGSNMYLASSSRDRCVKIWNLDIFVAVRTLNENVSFVRSLSVVNYDGKDVLVSGDDDGKIKMWRIEDLECVETIDAHSDSILALDMVEYNNKQCLVSGSFDNTVKIWDMQNKSAMTTLEVDSGIHTITVFRNGDRTCLASGGDKGNLKLWME